ncbi:hypothetical protein BHE90_010353 [Fusarium euwallaceae]|uniref:Uncharacterized protein n=1 Tax=Fusarium euwallaceae TaxID=1147111 RepID=A0A430LHK4_9HYPO|nr:hypothetical protein BHE90_010353 [Fusarium euwallaceae]
MNLKKLILSLSILFFGMVLAAPDAALGDNMPAHPLLKYTPGPLPSILRTMVKDPNGLLRVGTDGVLRSFAANASVLDYRHLSSAQTHGLAPDGRDVLSEAAILHSPRGAVKGRASAAGAGRPVGVGVPAAMSTDPAEAAEVVHPEILGECAPPVACWNSTTCGGGCGACTYFGFFPYGLCLSG